MTGITQEIADKRERRMLANIGWAIAVMRLDGACVRRVNWNGKGMWLKLQVPDANSKMTLPYIYIEYPVGHAAYPDGCRVPWLASQTDLLAEDWEVCHPDLEHVSGRLA